jgi:hypothetical protein
VEGISPMFLIIPLLIIFASIVDWYARKQNAFLDDYRNKDWRYDG